MTFPEQVRRAFLQATLQGELHKVTAEQERAINNRLDGKRGRQLVRRFPEVGITVVHDTEHWVHVTQSTLRCWYDLTFVIAVDTTLDRQLTHYSEKWGDEAAHAFATAHCGSIAARLERNFIAVAVPATQLPLSNAIALLQEKVLHSFRALRSEIPELARCETQRALKDVVAHFG